MRHFEEVQCVYLVDFLSHYPLLVVVLLPTASEVDVG